MLRPAAGSGPVGTSIIGKRPGKGSGQRPLPADKTEYRVGPWLAFDPETERFTGERAEKANALLHDTNRKGYEVPAKDNV